MARWLVTSRNFKPERVASVPARSLADCCMGMSTCRKRTHCSYYSFLKKTVWSRGRVQRVWVGQRGCACKSNMRTRVGAPIPAATASTTNMHTNGAAFHDTVDEYVDGGGGGSKISSTWLGTIWLRLLHGCLFYAPSFIMPGVTIAAGIGAVFGNHILSTIAKMDLITRYPLIQTFLVTLSSTHPWTAVTAVFFSLLSAWYAFLVMPMLDILLGTELRNPDEDEAKRDTLYRGILYAYVPVHVGVLVGVCHMLSTYPVPPLAFLGIIISCGVSDGIAFTVAHELTHGRKTIDKICANILLACVCYMHWSKSHLIHHVKVATPEDPSSAYKGETLYHFIPRSIIGNTRDGYAAEAKRRQKKKIPFWDPRNKVGVHASLRSVCWFALALCVMRA